jgi:hypothetical protein
MKKKRGHYCKICGCRRPNEAFSGKGHREHICKRCKSLPKEQLQNIQHKDEIFNYLRQSHISAKNITRLRKLASSSNARIAELASIVLDVAKVKPHKKKRLKVLAKKRTDLIKRLEETGLIMAHGY